MFLLDSANPLAQKLEGRLAGPRLAVPEKQEEAKKYEAEVTSSV